MFEPFVTQIPSGTGLGLATGDGIFASTEQAPEVSRPAAEDAAVVVRLLGAAPEANVAGLPLERPAAVAARMRGGGAR